MTQIRCSSLPLAARCSASLHPALQLRTDSEPARLGTAAHLILAKYVIRREQSWPEVAAVATSHAVDADELRILVAQGIAMWEQLVQYFHYISVEYAMEHYIYPGITLTGHVDVAGNPGGQDGAGMLDWKTGRMPSDYSAQMLGYCALWLLENGTAPSASCSTAWVRTGEVEKFTMTREELPAFIDKIRDIVANPDRYSPGEHCTHCPRAHECPAANAMLRADIAALSDLPPTDGVGWALPSLSADELIAMFERAKRMGTLADRIKDAIRDHAIQAGAPLVGSGSTMNAEIVPKRSLAPALAWSVLESRLGPVQMAECITISISQAEAAIRKNAGRGNGANAVAELTSALTAAGAIITTPTHRLSVRNNPQ